jgi:hypothetical protein
MVGPLTADVVVFMPAQCTVIDTLHAGHARETIAYMKADELSQYQVGTASTARACRASNLRKAECDTHHGP